MLSLPGVYGLAVDGVDGVGIGVSIGVGGQDWESAHSSLFLPLF